ncbi:MAG TPA: aspartyl protease family protein [Candidatus Baltobacteraceae bacterium]|nr:aspartyl protease family protein [Candidatus Baltobacteraceae bacterium]
MRVAVGGNTWHGVVETSANGLVAISGLHGTGRLDTDVARGRYAEQFNVAAMGPSAEVYDGTTTWAQDISGGVHPYDTPFARERAITSAFLDRREYFDPLARATITCLGTRVEDGRSVVVIRVRPVGGISADLAIDTRTHLLASVSEQLPLPMDDGVTRYADYRTVGGRVLPFSISVGTQSSPGDGFAFSVTRYVVRPRARNSDFAKPTAPNDMRMIGGATSTRVPMRLEGRQLVVWASVDGHTPMPFILDTGGHAILTTLAAKALGLHAQGAGESGGSGSGTISTQYTFVRSLRIGKAELLDQHVLVIPYPYSFYERGKKTPLAGILGLEWFERFAVRLDYGERTVTFTPLALYHHRGIGSSLRLMFEYQEDMPVVDAAADGHPGLFGTDTGNAGILILFGDFLKQTGLLERYSGGQKTVSQGTGGSNAGRAQILARFRLDGHVLRRVAANFTQMTYGSFASRTEAGNMGFSILSRFIPTFDYANGTLHLDPERRVTPFGVNRSGLGFVKNTPGAFIILLVRAGSAGAAAGIVPGDQIVAINGKDASNYSWADLISLVDARAGTRLVLRIQHARTVRNVTLVLR